MDNLFIFCSLGYQNVDLEFHTIKTTVFIFVTAAVAKCIIYLFFAYRNADLEIKE